MGRRCHKKGVSRESIARPAVLLGTLYNAGNAKLFLINDFIIRNKKFAFYECYICSDLDDLARNFYVFIYFFVRQPSF